MQRIALFSDIHGNLGGLQAVLDVVSARGADHILALGDYIAGGAATDAIIETLQAHNVQMVRGDSDTLDKYIRLRDQARQYPGSTRSSAEYYQQVYDWLGENLSSQGREFLAGLPLSITLEIAPGRRLYACHASPRSVGDRVCALRCDTPILREAYAGIDAEVVAFGHAHTPYTRWLDGRLYINVASVAFRSDSASMLTYLSYCNDQWTVEQQAVPYDLELERERSRLAGVPEDDAFSTL